jgi:hypothetical protein
VEICLRFTKLNHYFLYVCWLFLTIAFFQLSNRLVLCASMAVLTLNKTLLKHSA